MNRATPEFWQQEGQVSFQVGAAFYRPQSQVIRDLGVLAAAVYRRRVGRLRVLDGMAGCGVRSLRYALEAEADFVWANDGDPSLVSVLQANLGQLPAGSYTLSHEQAQRLLLGRYCQQDFYDWVDVDGFGNGADVLAAALWAVRPGGLLYLTSTDGQAIARRTLQTYGVYGRSHPAVHEQGLRLLLGCAHHLATLRGFGIEPIVSYFSGQTWRVLVQLNRMAGFSEASYPYGFLGYCPACGTYTPVPWRLLGDRPCPQDGHRLRLSGPLWLGRLHHPGWLQAMLTLAQDWGWRSRLPLLTVLLEEADMLPYYVPLGEIGRRGKCDVPGRSPLIQTLTQWGFRATRTHLHPQAIKTTADLATCIRAAQSGL